MQAFLSPSMAISPATAARRAALHHPVTTAVQSGFKLVTGVDEAGAGALAGPVVAAAVQLAPNAKALQIPYLDDSKRLSARRREQVFEALKASTDVTFAFSICSPQLIDQINVLNARMKAMNDAVHNLSLPPDILFVDGNRPLESVDCRQEPIIHGDAQVSVIAAASVVAKVVRDRIMRQASNRFQQFSFHAHVGYGTQQHIAELRRFGPCEIHRWSFKPVRNAAEMHNNTHPVRTQRH